MAVSSKEMFDRMIHSPAKLAAVFFIGILGYVLLLIIYRLTLHPLAKYPGPFLAKITSWYDAYQSWTGHRYLDQFRCQQKYGNVFRYGPNFLVIQTPEALQELYQQAQSRPVRKADNYYMNYTRGKVSTAFMIDKEEHAMKRKILSNAFSERALKAQEPIMVEQIDKWIKLLGEGSSEANKGWSSPKNMATYANYLTLDVLGSLCFGKAFGLMDGKLRDTFPNVLFGRTKQMQTFGNTSMPRFFKWLQENTSFEKFVVPGQAGGFAIFTKFVRNAFKEREANQMALANSGISQAPRQDFIHYLVTAKNPLTGDRYSQLELDAELRTLVGAGSDTTSTTIAASLYYLTRNPKALERVTAEVRSNFSNVNEILINPQIGKCEYLEGVIEETLRISPPIPSALKRYTEAPMVVGDIALPVHTEVAVSAWGIHHSDEYFPEAGKFKPERWLPEVSSKEQIAHMKAMFTPFSQGNRACIGRNMAYNELKIGLARLFWTYDVRLTPGDATGTGTNGFYNLIDIFISIKDGPVCEFRKRADI